MPVIKGKMTKFVIGGKDSAVRESFLEFSQRLEPEIIGRELVLPDKEYMVEVAERVRSPRVEKLAPNPMMKKRPKELKDHLPCRACANTGFNRGQWRIGFKTRCSACDGVGWKPKPVGPAKDIPAGGKEIIEAIGGLNELLNDIVREQRKFGSKLQLVSGDITTLANRVETIEEDRLPDGMVLMNKVRFEEMQVELNGQRQKTIAAVAKLKELKKKAVQVNIDPYSMERLVDRVQDSIQKEVNTRLVKEGVLKPEVKQPTGRRRIELEKGDD